jgi:hypothetical protein
MNDIQTLHEDFKVHIQSDQENFKKINEKLDRIDIKLDPLTQAYDGILFSKKFLLGMAGIVLAISAIGGGFIWLINSVIHRP